MVYSRDKGCTGLTVHHRMPGEFKLPFVQVQVQGAGSLLCSLLFFTFLWVCIYTCGLEQNMRLAFALQNIVL